MTTTTAVRERPIIMSAPMVRAIIDERKTVTRRVVKPQAWSYNTDALGQPVLYPRSGPEDFGDVSRPIRCPYGEPGGLLWVREAWRPWSWHEGEPITLEYKAGGPRHDCNDAYEHSEDWEERIWISVSDELNTKGVEVDEDGLYRWEESPLRWRPGIHLPKFGARIWLRVTDVRVERLQEITTEDVFAEGIQIPVSEPNQPLLRIAKPGKSPAAASYLPKGRLLPGHEPLTTDEWARIYFAERWDSLNYQRAPWSDDPYVWRITFERTERP